MSSRRIDVGLEMPTPLCYTNPMSDRGKRTQLLSFLVVVFIPIGSLIIFSAIQLSQAVSEKQLSALVQEQLQKYQHLGELVHVFQEERLIVTLALFNNEYARLTDTFNATHLVLTKIQTWPMCGFKTLESMTTSLNIHRRKVIFETEVNHIIIIKYYTDINNCLIEFLMQSVRETDNGLWRDLIAYKMIVKAKENIGIIFALGVSVLYGHQLRKDEYIDISNNFVLMSHHLQSAWDYSSYASDLFKQHRDEFPDIVLNFTMFVSYFSISIDNGHAALEKQSSFRTTAIEFFETLNDIKRQLFDNIISRFDKDHLNAVALEILYIGIFFVSVIIAPVLVVMMTRLTNKLQLVAMNLSNKSKQLQKEKQRSDALLYQLLPRQVAQQLKLKHPVTAEFYQNATVFFSDIVGFTNMSAQISPIQVVEVLNKLYKFFDECLDRYDVYKVETIGDAYMVVSGVPERNGTLHCSEIALMALDILRHTNEFNIPYLPDEKLAMRMGFHTGSCCSGVVGNKMPRYCLFGDTVNTASRMESYGLPQKIHISKESKEALDKLGGFITFRRGKLDIKGKGEMTTYWLNGTTRTMRHTKTVPNDQNTNAIVFVVNQGVDDGLQNYGYEPSNLV